MRFQALNSFLFQGSKLTGSQVLLLTIINLLIAVIVLFLPSKLIGLLILISFSFLILIYFRIHILQIFVVVVCLGISFFSGDRNIFIIIYNVFFGLMIFYYFISLSIKSEFPDKFSAHHIISAIFILFGIVGLLSMFFNSRFTGRGILETVRYSSLCPLFLIIYYFIKNETMVKKMAMTIIVISFIVASYSYILVFINGIQSFIIQGITALHGFDVGFANPNSMAMIIGYPLPLFISYLMFGKGDLKKRYTFTAILFLFIIWLLWNSRSTYIFLFFSVLVLVGFHEKRTKYFLFIAILLILGSIIVIKVPFLQELLRMESGLSLRDELWRVAVEIFKQKPIWGAGPGSYEDLKFYYMAPNEARYLIGTGGSGAAHNLFLTTASEMGIVAVIVLITYILFIITYFISHEKLMRGSNYYHLYVGCGAIYIGIIFRAFFERGGIIGAGRLSENVIPLLLLAIMLKLPRLKTLRQLN